MWERSAISVRDMCYALPADCSDEQLELILEIFPNISFFAIRRIVR